MQLRDVFLYLCMEQSTNPQVRDMALKVFQQWALAFESKRELSFLPEMYRELKTGGELNLCWLAQKGESLWLEGRGLVSLSGILSGTHPPSSYFPQASVSHRHSLLSPPPPSSRPLPLQPG